MLFYTSGTTGLPKGAEITHRGLVGAMGIGALAPTNLVVRSAVISLPVAHIMGFTALAGLAVAGVPVRFVPHFRPTDVMDEIENVNASLFVGVPAMYRMMDEAGAAARDLSSVRVWASGADVMPPELAEKFRGFGATAAVGARKLGKALFVEGYGMVETGGAVASKFGDRLVPLPGYRLRVDGETPEHPGELLVRGPSLLRGYHNRPGATSEAMTSDGWLRTGDLARAGSMGTVEFCGRAKHVIKVGGYSVFAREVERVLEEHPAVAEAAAVGLPDERLGEVVGVAVRLMPGATVSTEELLEHARRELAEYKQPRRMIILDELPSTGTNKVRRNALVDEF